MRPSTYVSARLAYILSWIGPLSSARTHMRRLIRASSRRYESVIYSFLIRNTDRILEQMVTVTDPARPFPLTAKGTPRRHVSLKDYEAEIDQLYRRVEESSRVDVAPPVDWTADDVTTFVQGVIHAVMRVSRIADDDDLFQQGCDRCACLRPSCVSY